MGNYKTYKNSINKKGAENLTKTQSRTENILNSKNTLEGGQTMTAQTTDLNLFAKGVMGSRELRSRISEVIDRVTNDYDIVISGNVKKNNTKTAAIISMKVLDDILSIYEFNPIINLDKNTNQYEVILDEIGIYGCGTTKEEAIQETIDMVIDITEDYFDNTEMYARIPTESKKYPYLLRIKNCNTKDEVKKVLNLL